MIMVGLAIAVLIGFLGIVIDLGRLFVTKTEMQSAMDACALAAAAELRPGVNPPDLDAINRAVSAGITAGNGTNPANGNRVGFQAASAGITAADIRFSDRLSDNSTSFPFGYVSSGTANPATARYAMCARTRGGINTWFMQVLEGFLGQPTNPKTVGAWATATLGPSQSNCAIPLGVCRQPGGAAPNFGLEVGRWYSSKFKPGPGQADGEPIGTTGNFNWIDFTPPNPSGACTPATLTSPCSGGGGAELACLMAGQGQCELPSEGSCVGATGAKQSLVKAWNSRFGIYKGGGSVSQADLTDSPPDYTGYGYSPSNWQPVVPGQPENAYAGSSALGGTPNFGTARSLHLSYSGSVDGGGYNIASVAQHTSNGADRRVVTVPIVNCDQWGPTPGQTVPVLGYACVLMVNPFWKNDDDVYLEYRGRTNVPGSPCATSGLAGANGPPVPYLVH